MSRLMTLGVLSQAIDPAAKMATDYCNYVIAQGGIVDYATVYSIYKNEILTDPDWQKLLYYFDFRAGIKFSSGSIIANVYNLIEPYNTNSGTSGSPTLLENERIEQGYLTGIYIGEKINPLSGSIRIVNKAKTVGNAGGNNYSFISYSSSNAVSNSIRLNSGSTRRYSYLQYSDGTLGSNSPLINYPNNEVHVTEQIIDYSSRIHRIVCSSAGVDVSQAIPADKSAHILPIDDRIGLRIFGYSYLPNYYLKIYKL